MSAKGVRGNRVTWLVAAGAVLLAAGIGYRSWKSSRPAKMTYRYVKVEKGKLRATILSTGTVQPENRVQIKPPIAGRIENVLVEEGAKVKKGHVLAWMSSTERAALLDAASARGADELKRWEGLYRPTPILSPIDGEIIIRNVESGQTVTSADAIFDMSDRLTVKAQVDETDIAQIQLHQKATIVLDAYPDQSIEAHVDQIAYDAKTVNNVTTYLVDVLPEKRPSFMRSGMTSNVSFEAGSKEDALVIPVEAVKIREGQPVVFVSASGDEGNPEQRTIQTGLSDGKRIEVRSGVVEGETLAIPQYQPGNGKGPAASNPFSPFGHSRGK